MSDGERKIVVIKRVTRKAAAHHGGSWKVAYADFVTAMMAFFLVMWIMGMDEGVRDLVQGYFSNPVGFRQSFSGGRNPTSAGNLPIAIDARNYLLLSREEQAENFEESAEDLTERLEQAVEEQGLSAAFEVAMTDQGLRIELMERADGDAFFEVGSSSLKDNLRTALRIVTAELRTLPNGIVIEGHTDARPFGGDDYTNWELSGDRAFATRRALLDLGLDPRRVVEVRGYAERRLKLPEQPFAPENRRITLLLPYQDDLIRPGAAPTGLQAAGGGGGSDTATSQR